MLREQVNIAWVEFLGVVKVRLALVPVAASAFDIRQGLGDTTVIGQKLICLLKVFHRSVVVLQTGVVIETHGKYGLAKIGLQSKSGFGRLPRFFAEGGGWLKTLCKVATRIGVGQQRPAKGKFRVQSHCFSKIALRAKRVSRCESGLERVSQAAEISIVGLRIVGRLSSDDFLFLAGKFGS